MNGTMQGDGTENNPYLIEDIKDLIELGNKMTNNTGIEYYVEQIQDIDVKNELLLKEIYLSGNNNRLIYKGNRHKINGLHKVVAGNDIRIPLTISCRSVFKDVYFTNMDASGIGLVIYIYQYNVVFEHCVFHGSMLTDAQSNYLVAAYHKSNNYDLKMFGCLIDFNVTFNNSSTNSTYTSGFISDGILYNCILTGRYISGCRGFQYNLTNYTKLNNCFINVDMSTITLDDTTAMIYSDTVLDDKGNSYNCIVNKDKIHFSIGSNITRPELLKSDAECKNINTFRDAGWWV